MPSLTRARQHAALLVRHAPVKVISEKDNPVAYLM